MQEVLIYGLALVWGVAVFGGWLTAAFASLVLVSAHRRPDRSAWWYAWNGWAFYTASSFAPSGAGVHKIFLLGIAGFALGLAAAFLGGALVQS